MRSRRKHGMAGLWNPLCFAAFVVSCMTLVGEESLAQGGCSSACADGSFEVTVVGWANLDPSTTMSVDIGSSDKKGYFDEAFTEGGSCPMVPERVVASINPGKELVLTATGNGDLQSSGATFYFYTCPDLEVWNGSNWLPGNVGAITASNNTLKVRIAVDRESTADGPGNGKPGGVSAQVGSGGEDEVNAGKLRSPKLNLLVELGPAPVTLDNNNDPIPGTGTGNAPSGSIVLSRSIEDIIGVGAGNTLRSKFEFLLHDSLDTGSGSTSAITNVKKIDDGTVLAEIEEINDFQVKVKVRDEVGSPAAPTRTHTFEVTGATLEVTGLSYESCAHLHWRPCQQRYPPRSGRKSSH